MDRPVVVAFSGGSDSASCLVYLVEYLNVECVAVMVDNGFIPDAVQSRATCLCRSLGVKMITESFSLVDKLPTQLCDPCSLCIPVILNSLALKARDFRSVVIATGHLYAPAFENLQVGTTRIVKTAPLYIDDVHENKRDRILRESGWDDTINFGFSSNCTLMGYVELLYRKKWGYSPMIAELSHEIRAGMISRDSALNKLEEQQSHLDQYQTNQYRKVEELLTCRGKLKS